LAIAPHSAAGGPPASPGARLAAVAVDIIVYAAIGLCCFIVAATVLLLSSNLGRILPGEQAYTAFQWLLFASAPIWDLLLFMNWARKGRSPGKVVAGCRIVGPRGRPIGPVRAVARILLYPLMSPTYAILFFVAFVNALGRPVAFAAGILLVATTLLSLVSLVLLFTDPRRRTVHDFLSGTEVRRLT
jgi:uncharacterized RDD family membrane protein YckC